MKIRKLLTAATVGFALVSGAAVAAVEDLTTWTAYGSVSQSPLSATMTGDSGISKSFSFGAGTNFSFNWFFQANDYLPYNDWSAVNVDGNLNIVLSNVGAVGDYGNSGWQTFSTTLLNPVNGMITFSVSNALDQALWSSLTVENVNVSAIPEPETYALLIAGLGLIGFATRRRQRRAA